MKIQLSDHFTYKKLFKFTLPSILMMVFTSIYGVVDGFFVSNYVGKDAFVAINLIMPFLIILGTLGFMLGAGGTALIGKTLGEGDRQKANKLFSLFVFTTLVLGIIIAVVGILSLRKVAIFLGAVGNVLENSIIYGTIILIALPFFMLQIEFQTFFVVAEKPNLGLVSTLISGVVNMVVDALLVAVLDLGVVGAAVATASSQMLGGLIPIIYFSCKNSSLLRLTKPELNFKALLKACTNGASELMSNISMSVIGMLYNFQLLKYAGENGVAAYGVLMYVNFVFISMFIGYSVGSAPITSYNFGAQNHNELKNVLKKSLTIINTMAILMLIAGFLLVKPLSQIYVGYDSELLSLTTRAFYIFMISFLFAGMAIFGSSFFTALNNGLISAIISFLRTLVFQVLAVLLLPLAFGVDGIWVSVVVAEFMAVVVTVIFMISKKKKYNY